MEQPLPPEGMRTAATETGSALKRWLLITGIMAVAAAVFLLLYILMELATDRTVRPKFTFGMFLPIVLLIWVPVWLGILHIRAGQAAGRFAERGDNESLAAFTRSLSALYRVLAIVSILLFLLLFIGAVLSLSARLSGIS